VLAKYKVNKFYSFTIMTATKCCNNQSINQSLFAAISKYSTTVVNRQLWTGQ